MDNKQLKTFGVICLVVCALCAAVALERYNTNAKNVRAINSMRQSMPFGGGMPGATELKPATPAATKYALVGAVLTGLGGVVLLVKSGSKTA